MAIKFDVTADSTGFVKAMKDIRDAVVTTSKLVEQIANRMGTQAGQVSGEVKKVAEAEKEVGQEAEKAGAKGVAANTKIGKAADHADKSVKELSKDVGRSAEGFDKLSKAAGAFFTLQAAQGFARQIFAVRAEIESLQTSFRVLVGDNDKADALFQGIKEFAVSTPMQMKDLAAAAQTMMGFGLPLEQIMENLKAIGDVSMGDTQRFQSLALSFSQMSAAGKLMGQDLMQMINAGFNPLATISEKTGKSIGKLKEEMEGGAISADMVRQAFIDATSEGGKFNGMLEKQSKTLGGAYSNLQGAIDDMFNEIGEKTEGVFTTAIDLATKLAQNYKIIGNVIAELVIAFGSYKAAVMAISAYEAVINANYVLKIRYLRTLVTLQKLLNATMLSNPYVIAATALGSLAGALYLTAKRTKEVDVETKQLNDSFSKTQAEISAEQTKIDQLFEKLKKAKVGTEEYKNIKQQILGQYGDYLSGLGAEIATLKNVEGAYKAVSKAARAAALARGMETAMRSAQDNYNERYADNYTKIFNAISQNYGEDYANRIMGNIRTILQKGGELPSRVIDMVGGLKGVKAGWLVNLSHNEQQFKSQTRRAQEMFSSDEDRTKDLSKTVRDKKAIEEEKKAAEAELNALSVIEAKGKKGKAIKDRIASINKELEEAYDPKHDEKTAKSAAAAARKQAALDKKEEQEAIRQAEAEERIFGLKTKQKRDEERAIIDLEFSTREAEIKAKKESTDNVIRQIRLDYDREIESIRRGMEDLRQQRIDAAKAIWDASPKNKGKDFWKSAEYAAANLNTESEIANSNAQRQAARAERDKRLSEIADSENAAMREFLIQYGSYQQQRLAIEEKYDDLIEKARTDGEKMMLKKQKDEDLHSVDERFGKVTQAMADLFADASKKSVKSIQAIIDKYEALVKYLEGHKGSADADMLKSLGLSQEDIASVLTGKTSIKELTDRLKELKGELKDKSPYQSFASDMKEAIKKIKAATNGDELGGGITNMASAIQSFLPALKEFGSNVATIFGADDSKLSAAIDGLDGLMTASQGVGQVMSGDVVGGVMTAVKGVAQIVSSVDGMFGADWSRYNKMVEEYEGLVKVWDVLIDKKKEYISESYGIEAYQAGEEAKRLLANEEEAWRRLGREFVNTGASAGAHSKGVRMRKRMTDEDWSAVAASLGRSTDNYAGLGGRLAGLFDLTAEQLEKLRGDAPAFWAKLNQETQDYLNKIIDGADKLKEIEDTLKAQYTSTTFDSVYDAFKGTLSDMDKSAFDFSQDFQKYMFDAILNTKVDELFKERIQGWYDAFAKANEDGNIDSSEMASLRAEWEALGREGVELRETLRKTTGYGSSSEGSAVYNASKNFTQEQGDVLNGRMTAIQMGVRQEVILGEQIAANLKSMQSLVTNSAESTKAVVEIRNMMVSTNLYLDTIARTAKETSARLEQLDTITAKIREL